MKKDMRTSNLIPVVEEPKVDWCRKVNIVYTERLGNACKTFNINMYMTFDELMDFVGKTMNAQGQQEKGKGNDRTN